MSQSVLRFSLVFFSHFKEELKLKINTKYEESIFDMDKCELIDVFITMEKE